MRPLAPALVWALVAAPLASGAPAAPGEEARITLDVREAEIADVVRVLAELANFQVVMDSGTSCRLTLKLKQVRWPKVLDLALRSCGLAYEEENAILRIAPAVRLAQEAADQAKLVEQRRASAPPKLATFRLSYARAQELAPVVKRLLSPRGDVVWDARTNTLYIVD